MICGIVAGVLLTLMCMWIIGCDEAEEDHEDDGCCPIHGGRPCLPTVLRELRASRRHSPVR